MGALVSWDQTQDVGKNKSMDRSDSVIMVDGNWTLERASWLMEPDAPGIIWARHYGCLREGVWRTESPCGEWFPRDNAIIGKCCYCGDPVPEHFVTLFMLHNWQWIPEWEPIARSRMEK